MCYSCWEDWDKPAIDTPAVREAALAVIGVYEYHAAGGNMHIVLDDWNIEDEHVVWCRNKIADGGFFGDDSSEQLAVELRCCDLFLALSESERAAALALIRGFWK